MSSIIQISKHIVSKLSLFPRSVNLTYKWDNAGHEKTTVNKLVIVIINQTKKKRNVQKENDNFCRKFMHKNDYNSKKSCFGSHLRRNLGFLELPQGANLGIHYVSL